MWSLGLVSMNVLIRCPHYTKIKLFGQPHTDTKQELKLRAVGFQSLSKKIHLLIYSSKPSWPHNRKKNPRASPVLESHKSSCVPFSPFKECSAQEASCPETRVQFKTLPCFFVKLSMDTWLWYGPQVFWQTDLRRDPGMGQGRMKRETKIIFINIAKIFPMQSKSLGLRVNLGKCLYLAMSYTVYVCKLIFVIKGGTIGKYVYTS